MYGEEDKGRQELGASGGGLVVVEEERDGEGESSLRNSRAASVF